MLLLFAGVPAGGPVESGSVRDKVGWIDSEMAKVSKSDREATKVS